MDIPLVIMAVIIHLIAIVGGTSPIIMAIALTVIALGITTDGEAVITEVAITGAAVMVGEDGVSIT